MKTNNIKDTLVKIMKITTAVVIFSMVIVFWPRIRCGKCGHVVEPGISIVCSHCGNLLTGDSYVYCWWLKNDEKQNSYEKTDQYKH